MEIGPHVFTQHDITKLKIFQAYWLKTGMKGTMAFSLFLTTCHHHCHHCYPLKVYSTSPLGSVELPQTTNLIAGGSFLDNITFKATRFYQKLLYGNLFDSSSSEDEDDPAITSVIEQNLQMTNKILPNTVRQALKVIAMAMKKPEPHQLWAMIN